MRPIKRKPEFWFVALLLVMAYFIFVIWKDLRGLGALDRERLTVLKSFEREIVFRKGLEWQAQSLKRSGQLELLARQKLGMIKNGETPFKIINAK
ncbi:MAG: septum formation initiator family protein [Candidatus Margulisiibacteriota bacterium]